MQAETRERPNVILIKVDDLDFDELGYAGSDRHLTPAIDALAANGLRFVRGYVTSTVCTPSRYSTLTGRFASRSRALQAEPTSSWRRGNYPPGGPANVHFNTPLHPDERTAAHPLQKAGYATDMVGKWPLDHDAGGLNLPEDADPESETAPAAHG